MSVPVLEKVVNKNDAKVFTPFIIEIILNNELKLPSLANPVIIELRKLKKEPITGPFSIDI